MKTLRDIKINRYLPVRELKLTV